MGKHGTDGFCWGQVGRLRQALHEYESERWRVVSSRVGHGFSAAACKLKAEELELAALAA